ncbi:MAG: pimeloyl-ACP methyl ester esterase BioH [Steroidobacteraceae bacterium]|nr:pimeloyl-ACP methyl ester esterase BioH [Steroidobacteraceae bacterium]MDW8260833.1 pimeloyl-ACP methyl ester esterase BioH [Gammaproteobacteria bacterium]
MTRLAAGAVYVEAAGRGPQTLACLHGWGLNLRVFDPLRALLAEDCRTIALDLPGHGRSGAAATCTLPSLAAAVWDALPPDPLALLGWSFGGQVALQMALQQPARCRALVLIATTPRFVAADDWPHGMPAATAQQFLARLLADVDGTIRDFLELQVRGSSAAATTLQALRAALGAHGRPDVAWLEAALATLLAADLRSDVAALGLPALVIAGQHDRITPVAASRALAQALPQARLLELARAAHAPFLSHPRAVATAVREFLAAL